jgi:hypothetical protein
MWTQEDRQAWERAEREARRDYSSASEDFYAAPTAHFLAKMVKAAERLVAVDRMYGVEDGVREAA